MTLASYYGKSKVIFILSVTVGRLALAMLNRKMQLNYCAMLAMIHRNRTAFDEEQSILNFRKIHVPAQPKT